MNRLALIPVPFYLHVRKMRLAVASFRANTPEGAMLFAVCPSTPLFKLVVPSGDFPRILLIAANVIGISACPAPSLDPLSSYWRETWWEGPKLENPLGFKPR